MNNVLNLIRGLVRPLLVVILTCAVVAGFFLDKLPPDALLALSGTAAGYWFGSRKPSS